MTDEGTKNLIKAILGEADDLPAAESLPTQLVDALRERLRGHDGGDRDLNLLAAYLEGKLDQEGRLKLLGRILTAEEAGAPSAGETADIGTDIGEELREARRWANRLEEATIQAPPSFTEAAIGIQPGPDVVRTINTGLFPTWIRSISWAPVASIASVALVFVVGLNLIGRDLYISPDEGIAPAQPADSELSEMPAALEDSVTSEPMAPAMVSPAGSSAVRLEELAPVESREEKGSAGPPGKSMSGVMAPTGVDEGVEEVIVTGSRLRRDGFSSSAPDQSDGLGSLESLDTSEMMNRARQDTGGQLIQTMEFDQSQIVMQDATRLAELGTAAYEEGRFDEAVKYFEAAILGLENSVPADHPTLVELIELRDLAIQARDGVGEAPPPE